jgi:hypothetical protein
MCAPPAATQGHCSSMSDSQLPVLLPLMFHSSSVALLAIAMLQPSSEHRRPSCPPTIALVASTQYYCVRFSHSLCFCLLQWPWVATCCQQYQARQQCSAPSCHCDHIGTINSNSIHTRCAFACRSGAGWLCAASSTRPGSSAVQRQQLRTSQQQAEALSALPLWF